MGRRKFKIGRAHKNYEKKRQLAGKNSVGRPPKRRKQVATASYYGIELEP